MSATVLPFPQTKRAIRHYETGMDAAGLLSLLLMDREGEPAPENVKRFDRLDESRADEFDKAMLSLLVFSVLTPKQKERIRSAVRCQAYGTDANGSVIRLHNILNVETSE
jgi:hypothetical protein